MSDQKTRELERLASQGDIHAGARLLRSRVREGVLKEENLLLIAWLGDPSAKVLTASPVIPVNEWLTELLAKLGLTIFHDLLSSTASNEEDSSILSQIQECFIPGVRIHRGVSQLISMTKELDTVEQEKFRRTICRILLPRILRS